MSTAMVEVNVTDWSEADYHAIEGPVRVAQAEWPTQYAGDLEGNGSVRALLAYTAGQADDPATLEARWVGLERITGTLDGRQGGFVLQLVGTHTGGVAKADAQIVPDSGTDGLAGISGTASYEVTGMKYTMSLTYDLS